MVYDTRDWTTLFRNFMCLIIFVVLYLIRLHTLIKEGKNRALVDSDNENDKSDSSDDEESNLDDLVDVQIKGHSIIV